MTRNSHHGAIFVSKFAAPTGRRPELVILTLGRRCGGGGRWRGCRISSSSPRNVWAAGFTGFDGF
jgi:hypothetical protein